MSTLAVQQRALLRALWLPHYETAMSLVGSHLARADARAMRGLRAYRSHGRALAARVLGAAYPSVLATLGDENFQGLARAHWLRYPPSRGDVAAWGAQLALHIEAMPQLVADEPGLADLARVDWAMHLAATAPDAQAQLASLQLLVDTEPTRITLRLAPGAAVVAGTLVWRQGLVARSRPLGPGEGDFARGLLRRLSLANALDAAADFDFNEWLAPAVHEGLVLGARRLRRCKENEPC